MAAARLRRSATAKLDLAPIPHRRGDAAAIFNLPHPPPPNGWKKKKNRSRRVRGPRPAGSLPGDSGRCPSGPPAPRLPLAARLPLPSRRGPQGLRREQGETAAARAPPRVPARRSSARRCRSWLRMAVTVAGLDGSCQAPAFSTEAPPQPLATSYSESRPRPTRSVPPPRRSPAAGCDAALFKWAPLAPQKARFPGPAYSEGLANCLLPVPDVTYDAPPRSRWPAPRARPRRGGKVSVCRWASAVVRDVTMSLSVSRLFLEPSREPYWVEGDKGGLRAPPSFVLPF